MVDTTAVPSTKHLYKQRKTGRRGFRRRPYVHRERAASRGAPARLGSSAAVGSGRGQGRARATARGCRGFTQSRPKRPLTRALFGAGTSVVGPHRLPQASPASAELSGPQQAPLSWKYVWLQAGRGQVSAPRKAPGPHGQQGERGTEGADEKGQRRLCQVQGPLTPHCLYPQGPRSFPEQGTDPLSFGYSMAWVSAFYFLANWTSLKGGENQLQLIRKEGTRNRRGRSRRQGQQAPCCVNSPFSPPVLRSGAVFTGESAKEALLGEGK